MIKIEWWDVGVNINSNSIEFCVFWAHLTTSQHMTWHFSNINISSRSDWKFIQSHIQYTQFIINLIGKSSSNPNYRRWNRVMVQCWQLNGVGNVHVGEKLKKSQINFKLLSFYCFFANVCCFCCQREKFSAEFHLKAFFMNKLFSPHPALEPFPFFCSVRSKAQYEKVQIFDLETRKHVIQQQHLVLTLRSDRETFQLILEWNCWNFLSLIESLI